MRVWELARELGKESSELVAELQELGFGVTAPASGLNDDEVEAIRKAYAALKDAKPEEASEDASATKDAEEGTERPQTPQVIPQGDGDYVLVRKGSISAGGVVVQKGGTIREAAYRTLPARVQKFFDKV